MIDEIFNIDYNRTYKEIFMRKLIDKQRAFYTNKTKSLTFR